MGLTAASTGLKAVDNGLNILREEPDDRVIALAGNPNVGKSTVFNALTGMNQHTGNWPGKTVSNAQGRCVHNDHGYIMVDIPGTYSLLAHSAEEEVARDFICFGEPDAVIVVCDATCLERNLNLVLQTMEITPHVAVCVNLMDEAKKKRIRIDLNRLERNLGVPVIGASARSGRGIRETMDRAAALITGEETASPAVIRYAPPIEEAIALLEPVIRERTGGRINTRWMALKLLDADESLTASLSRYLDFDVAADQTLQAALSLARERVFSQDITPDGLQDAIVSGVVRKAEEICLDTVFTDNGDYNLRDRKIDRVLTSKRTGIPLMLLLLDRKSVV